MEEMKQKVSSLDNLYLAYERVIHNSFNTELILDVEKALFERDIIESLNEIKKDLEDDKGLTESKFSIVMKIKDIEEKENINYRPLVIFKLKDHIYMQAIFNIVIDELKNFLPEENLGVVINTGDNSYLYENWIKSYSKFINRQKENLSSHSTYQFAFEYDITQFFPSINQNALINDINAFIEDDWLKEKVKEVIKFYNEKNLDETSKINYNEYLESMDEDFNKSFYRKDFGIPQGATFSPFLAAFYTRDLDHEIRKNLNKDQVTPIDIDYFSYVDDGRIYFHNYLNEEIIMNSVENALKNISKGEKLLKLSQKKTTFLELDDKGISAKLKILEENISMTQRSIVQTEDFDENDFEILNELHDNTTNMFEILKQKAKDFDNNYGDDLQYNYNKVDKVEGTFIKRYASKASKKLSSGNNFYIYLDKLFTIEANSEYRIDKINFEYVFSNMLNVCDSSEKIYALFDTMKAFINKLDALKPGINMFNYYKSVALKYFFSLPFSQLGISIDKSKEIYQKLIDKITNEDIQNDFMFLPLHEEWHETLNMVLKSDNSIINKGIHSEEVNKYLKVISLKNQREPFAKIVFKDENQKDKIPVFKKNIDCAFYEIYLVQKEENENDTGFSYSSIMQYDEILKNKKINNNIQDRLLVNILKCLVSFWKNRFHAKLLLPSLLNYEFFYMITLENEVDELSENKKIYKLYLCENENLNYYCLKTNYSNMKYKNDFKKLFEYYFKCNNEYYIDDFGKSLPFWKFRILNYLNGIGFDMEYFFDLLKDSLNNFDDYSQYVDGNYLQVKTLLEPMHLNAKFIDKIMLTHYFYTSVWKNGSPDLPFFTLHNQEHSVQLIENYVKLTNKMKGYFALTKLETYFLIVSCYLHDLGMLHGPEKKELYNMQNDKVSKLFKEYEKMENNNEIDEIIKSDSLLHSLYSIYEKVKNLNSDIARDNHALNSKIDIEQKSCIPLFDNEEKYIIGQVSLNHYVDADEVYGKENTMIFDGQVVDIRKISIYLRLLDLTDIGKNRVSKDVLNWNSNRMGLVSNFHWIKHLATNGILINSRIKNQKLQTEDMFNPKPCLEIEIIINYNYLPPMDKIAKTNFVSCQKFEKCNQNEIYERKNDKCNGKTCNLRCKFLNTQYYFDDEISNFNKYISKDERVNFILIHQLDQLSKREDIKITYKNLVTGEELKSATALILKYFK